MTMIPTPAEDYRAFVGPPDQYDLIGAMQFRLLAALGLRESHTLLDLGCGSLRAGRLFIPYLLPGKYFGIDPNKWLIQKGIEMELGNDLIKIKRPLFSHNDDFDCSVFGFRFDYILAQSILSHTGKELARKVLRSMAAAAKDECLLVFTFAEKEGVPNGGAGPGWLYPWCVRYSLAEMGKMVEEAGLIGMAIPWHHPRQVWFVASKTRSKLPDVNRFYLLGGTVFNVSDF